MSATLNREHLTITGFSLVFIAAVLVHLGAIHLPFQWDDALILRDGNIRLGRLGAFIYPPVPRSLTWLSFMLQSRLSGNDPEAWHATNVLIHALNAGLVFLLLVSLLDHWHPGGRPWNRIGAMFGATVFAVHPVQSEAVFYVYQRSTLMSVGFGLLAWLLYLKDRSRLSGLAWLTAVTCKESALVFPLVLWLSRGLTRGRWRPDRFLAACFATMGLGVGAHLLYWSWTGQATLGGSPSEAFRYLVDEVEVWWRYAALVLHLQPLNLDHAVAPIRSWPGAAWWCAVGGSLLVLFGLLRLRRRTPATVLFGAVFIILLLPTSSLIPSQDLMVEHRLYGPMIGWAGLLGLFARHAYPRLARLSSGMRAALVATLTLSLLGLTAYDTWATQSRMQHWKSPESLWRDTVRKSPEKYRPNFNLGVLLMDKSPAEASRYLERAIELDRTQPAAFRSLGALYLAQGNIERAEELWKHALSLAPDDVRTLVALGRIQSMRRDYFGAAHFFRKIQSIQPDDWRGYYLEARLNLEFGFVGRAVRVCEAGLEANPTALQLRQLLVQCRSRIGPSPATDGNP